MRGGGGEPEQLGRGGSFRWSLDGKRIYFRLQGQSISELSVEDGAERLVADLAGKRGELGVNNNFLATDGKHLYFLWREDFGDIWVMDVVRE